ncbi:MAG: hypothetical protein HXS52_03855 [Theionarchaea archaeon]|nr:hypothetical protein [Theionarchaea archaeon]
MLSLPRTSSSMYSMDDKPVQYREFHEEAWYSIPEEMLDGIVSQYPSD